jgi:hypothetical protein
MALVTRLCVVATIAALASVAAASGTSAVTRAGDFCSVSRNVAKNLVAASKISQSATPERLKSTWGAIKEAEPALKASATGSVKANLVPVLAFVDVVVADLKKVNWQVAGLAPYATTLIARANRVQPNLNALERYYRTTCHFHV